VPWKLRAPACAVVPRYELLFLALPAPKRCQFPLRPAAILEACDAAPNRLLSRLFE
jgi:hypothetical protein